MVEGVAAQVRYDAGGSLAEVMEPGEQPRVEVGWRRVRQGRPVPRPRSERSRKVRCDRQGAERGQGRQTDEIGEQHLEDVLVPRHARVLSVDVLGDQSHPAVTVDGPDQGGGGDALRQGGQHAGLAPMQLG